MSAETLTPPVPTQPVTINYFLKRLQERVSRNDARLLLDAAVIVSGLKGLEDRELNKEEASHLCMELIKKGGPAFQVGSLVYRELPQ